MTILSLVAVVLLYVGSIAPVFRFTAKGTRARARRVYQPVFALMEHTPLRSPLITWCEVWGSASDVRRILREREMRTWFDSGDAIRSEYRVE